MCSTPELDADKDFAFPRLWHLQPLYLLCRCSWTLGGVFLIHLQLCRAYPLQMSPGTASAPRCS